MQEFVPTAALVALAGAAFPTGAAENGVFVGRQPLTAIHVTAAADQTGRFAAEELQRYVRMLAGVDLRIDSGAEAGAGSIALRTAPTGQDGQALGNEGFAIRTTPDRVVVTGACPRAVLYGVYALLEQLGCRWCFPAPEGEVVPRRDRVDIPPLDVVEVPSFSYRTFQHCAAVDEETIDWIDWMAKNRMNRFMVTLYAAKGYKGQEYSEFKSVPGLLGAIRKRGILIEAGHHSLYYWLPPEKHFDRHPEWYSMVDGQRPRVVTKGKRTQLCFANPAVADAVTGRILTFIRENPEADVISLYTNDGLGYCECPECARTGSPTDAYVQFVNRVAETVHREAPGKTLSMLSYNEVKAPAHRTRLFGANTLCAIATWPPPDAGRIKGWLGSGVGQVALYEYYMGSYSDRSLPGCWTQKIAEELRTIHRLGLAGVATQCELANWGSYSLNYWVCARLLWNVDRPLAQVIDDYLEHTYGPAAPAMEQYFDHLETQGRMRKDLGIPETLLANMRQALEKAEGLAGDDPALRARLARDRLSFRYLELAWQVEARERESASALRQGDRQRAVQALLRAVAAADACIELLLAHRTERVFLAGRKDVPHEVVGHFYTTRYYEAKKSDLEKQIVSARTRPLSPDLALHKQAASSSDYSRGSTADRAVDGRDETLWSSAYSPSRPATHKHALPQWLCVDLGEERRISAIVLRTPKQLYHYRIELSSDEKAWRQVAEKRDDVLGSVHPGLTHTFSPRPARWVRVTVTSNPKNAAHVYELEVYETATADMIAASEEHEQDRERKRVMEAFQAHLRERIGALPARRISEAWPERAREWDNHAPALRQSLRDVFRFPETSCELRTRQVGEVDLGEVVIEKVLYDSEPQSVVTANVYRPAGPGGRRRPALILPSGHGGSKSSPYNQYMGQMYAKAGCVVLAFDPVGEEERDEKGRLGVRGHRIEHRIDRCLAMGRPTIAKMVYDAVRGIDYLVSRPDVDPERIACAGHSLGGTLTEYVTAADERVRVSLPTAWTCNFGDIVGELSCCWRPPGLLRVAGDPELFAAAAPRCAVLVLAGGADACPMHVDRFRESTLPLARRVFGLYGNADRMSVHVTPKAGHQPFQVNRAALLWMEQYLGLPAWSRKAMEALPELTDVERISSRLGGDDVLPAGEVERLVKARAVDCGVELLAPKALRCVSPRDWASDELGFASWVERLEARRPVFEPPATRQQAEAERERIVEALRAVLSLPERDARVAEVGQAQDVENGTVRQVRFGTFGLTAVLATPEDVAPPWPCVLYLDESRTTRGALDRVRSRLAQGQAALALETVPFDDSAVLLGTSSTAYNVAHVLEGLDMLAAREDIDARRMQCVSGVDDVGLLAAVLDTRVSELVIEAAGGTRCEFQGYRLNGTVPGLRAVLTRAHLLAALAPRRLTVCTREAPETVEDLARVYALFGKQDQLTVPHE